jgi:hypothetical protein
MTASWLELNQIKKSAALLISSNCHTCNPMKETEVMVKTRRSLRWLKEKIWPPWQNIRAAAAQILPM